MQKIKMDALFITQGLRDTIELHTKIDGKETLSSKTLEQVVEIDNNDISIIILSLGDSIIRKIARENTILRLWAKLELVFYEKISCQKTSYQEENVLIKYD